MEAGPELDPVQGWEGIGAGRMSDELKKRVSDLERVLADLPGYIDDWEWMTRNFDVLKTVPGFPFPYDLWKRLEDEKLANQCGS